MFSFLDGFCFAHASVEGLHHLTAAVPAFLDHACQVITGSLMRLD